MVGWRTSLGWLNIRVLRKRVGEYEGMMELVVLLATISLFTRLGEHIINERSKPTTQDNTEAYD